MTPLKHLNVLSKALNAYFVQEKDEAHSINKCFEIFGLVETGLPDIFRSLWPKY